jgi:hypothetical protein
VDVIALIILDVKAVSMLDLELPILMEDLFVDFHNHLHHNVLMMHAVELPKMEIQQLD